MSETPEPNLQSDPLLRDAPTIRGFKVLDPAVLYAKVGQGGMGAVYRGRHCKLDIDVAVKCLRPSLADESPDFAARFEREARLAAQLTHQNVVNVMDVHQKHGLHYLVMEFVTGEDARARVLRKGKLGEQEALAILLGAVSGLAEAHARGIVHRDIKPDNVLVSLEGRVKLADLGLAKASQSSGQSMSLASGVMGTPQYMPPEQWDSPDVTATADIWALGATLYYLLVGEHAVQAATLPAMARMVQEQPFPSLRDARPGLREAVYALFERCVSKEPSDRFPDARALLKVLRPLVEIDEGALADAKSGAVRAEDSLVSPPPRQTLMTIRAELQSGLLTPEGDERGSEAQTIASKGRSALSVPETLVDRLPAGSGDGAGRGAGETARADSSRGKPWKVLVALLGVAGLAFAAAWLGGVWDEPSNWEQSERAAKAKQLCEEGQKLLPSPGGLDEAIRKFEACLDLMPEYQAARAPLAMALDKRAEKLADTDLDAAFQASRRANELDGNKKAIAARFQVLNQAMVDRLFGGLEIYAPSGSDVNRSQFLVSEKSEFELKGRITSKGFKQLRILAPIALVAGGASAGAWRTVPVVAGEFSALLKLPVARDSTLQIEMSDELGVSDTISRTIRVCGIGGIRIGVGVTPLTIHYNAAGCCMKGLKAGTFTMGSIARTFGRDSDERQSEVVLSSHFWMAETEVTRAQWRRVMGSDVLPNSEQGGSLDLPANNMTRTQALEFCRKLTDLEQMAGRLPKGFRYSLPSEAEWEYAAAGLTIKPLILKGNSKARTLAIFGQARPQVVGSTRANQFGLYDMLGNVAEWCLDSASKGEGPNIVTATVSNRDPICRFGDLAVYRGGAYNSPKKDCRAAARAAWPESQASEAIGFRPVMVRR